VKFERGSFGSPASIHAGALSVSLAN
jgi:hypothetical protein